MSPAIYLINPAADFPTYFGAEAYRGRNFQSAALFANLAVPTIAAMVPGDFEVFVCDEYLSTIDFDLEVPFVGITGNIGQKNRMIAVADEFRRRGATVIIGGPLASLSPEIMRAHCDVLVRGEMEEICHELFADLRDGTWHEEYVGGKPDLGKSPVPRWDLYPNHRAIMGTVQTSRGCPYECDFCDVIQYLGRTQRHKSPAQVLRELDVVYRFGYRQIFLADDNFTIYRARTKELLAALRDWNLRQQDGKVGFVTQVSIDAAKDDELLAMCAEAGLTHVFIGIETPNEESLRASKKRQNLKINLAQQVQRFLDYGIGVTGGMIIGFDADGHDIFERQYDFVMSTPIPIFSLGALVAPAATPLYSRMKSEGRLVPEGTEAPAVPWSTNIVPRQMTREQLLSGIQQICRRIYEPAAFGERVLRFMRQMGPRRDPRRNEKRGLAALRSVEIDRINVLTQLTDLGPKEARMFSTIQATLSRNPDLADFVLPVLDRYVQVRYMYDLGQIWNPPTTPEASPSSRDRLVLPIVN